MNSLRILLRFLFISMLFHSTADAADPGLAATATNELGLDLYRKLAAGDNNLCLSPYSIQAALAMTFGGADGATRTEMARALHFPNGAEPHASFAALQRALEEMAARTAQRVAASKKYGGPSEPITLAIANRLFPQKGYNLRESFLALVKKEYCAPLEPLDFKKDAAAATKQINDWVAEQTRQRIRDLIPARALDAITRLVLANAVYLKAPWDEKFSERATKPEPFHVHGGAPVDAPTMQRTDREFGSETRWIHCGQHSIHRTRTSISRSASRQGQRARRTRIQTHEYHAQGMRKNRTTLHASTSAEVQARATDGCALLAVGIARHADRVRSATRQRQLRSSRAPKARRLPLHFAGVSQDVHLGG